MGMDFSDLKQNTTVNAYKMWLYRKTDVANIFLFEDLQQL